MNRTMSMYSLLGYKYINTCIYVYENNKFEVERSLN